MKFVIAVDALFPYSMVLEHSYPPSSNSMGSVEHVHVYSSY